MPRKTDEYVLGTEAAAIISKNSGRKITPNYVRVLASDKHLKIRSRMRDGRTREYHRGDCENYRVEQRAEKTTETESEESEALAIAI